MSDREREKPDAPEFDSHRKWKKLSAPIYGPCKHLDAAKYEQTIYFSDQVGNEAKGTNKLVKQNLTIPNDGYSPMDHLNSWKENQRSPYFKKDKIVILHPGDCNKIMEVKNVDDVVVTHGDCEDVFLWNFERQAQANAQNKKGKAKSIPDLRLIGHTNHAPFALSTSSASSSIASGGEDNKVLVWNLDDYAAAASLGLPASGASTLTRGQCTPGDVLQQREVLSGHEKTVTSVCFKPTSDNVLLSTADDHVLKLWDVREKRATCSITQAAKEDIMCSDWSQDQNYVATGAGNGVTHVYDVRKFTSSSPEGETGSPVLEFVQYIRPQAAALTVAWNPRKPAWLSTSGDDGRVCVYDTARPTVQTADRLPAQLVLQHIGHLGNIMDCQWSPHDDFTMMSISNDSETYKDGGALQLWRLSFLLHSPVEEAMGLLKEHQRWLESGKIEDIPKNVPPRTVSATAAADAQAAPGAGAHPAAPAAATAAAGTPVAEPAQAAVDAAAAPAAEGAGGGDVNMSGVDVGADAALATGAGEAEKAADVDVEMQDA